MLASETCAFDLVGATHVRDIAPGEVVAIIEVRTRGAGSWQRALASIDRTKRQRLSRAARILWSRRFSKMAGVKRVRFDVAAVVRSRLDTVVSISVTS